MKILEAPSVTKVSIYKTEKRVKSMMAKKEETVKKRRKTIEFYFVLLFGHIIEKSALKYERTYAKK